MAADYSFRYRLQRSPRDAINIEEPHWEMPAGAGLPRLTLMSSDKTTAIKNSTRLVFKSSGWSSERDAYAASERYFPALAVTLSRLRIGVDWGDRAPKGSFTEAGIAWLEEQTGQRYMNDVHGAIVYESEPPPVFVGSDIKAVRGVPTERFAAHFSAALRELPVLNRRERLSMTLFNSSFFQDAADSRFLLLMIAVEALLDPLPRSAPAVAHVKQLIDSTRSAQELTKAERESMVGSLNWMLQESISQTGRDLMKARLGGREYLAMDAPRFFTHCYCLRSRLVHGLEPFPTREEVDRGAAQLEVLVADLLSAQWLGFEE